MNKTHMLWSITLSAALLIGCSSGGESSPDPEPTIGGALPENPDTNSETPVIPSVQTSELQADASFDFATSWDMDIDFTLPLDSGFLSLCTDYAVSDSAQPVVDFASCIIRTPIASAAYQSPAVPMTNEISSLMAVLIDYGNPSQPLYVEFPITTGQASLTWDQGTTM